MRKWVGFGSWKLDKRQPLGVIVNVDPMESPTDPQVLWRLSRGRSTAHATVFPGERHVTVTWFFDDVMDRAENYEALEIALARADHIRGVLLRDGWRETSS